MKFKQIFVITDVDEDEIIGATDTEEYAIQMIKDYLHRDYYVEETEFVVTKIDNFYHYDSTIHYVFADGDQPENEREFILTKVIYAEEKR